MATRPIRTAVFKTSGIETLPAITTTEAKAWCNVTTDDDDALFEDLVDQATDWAEGYTGIAFVSNAYTNYFDRWPNDGEFLELSPWPIGETNGEVESSAVVVSYMDENFDVQTYSANKYRINNKGPGGPEIYLAPEFGSVTNNSWPALYSGIHDAVRVAYSGGIASSASGVPNRFKVPMLNFVLAHYEGRACGEIDDTRLELISKSLAPYIRHNRFPAVF